MNSLRGELTALRSSIDAIIEDLDGMDEVSEINALPQLSAPGGRSLRTDAAEDARFWRTDAETVACQRCTKFAGLLNKVGIFVLSK